MAARTACNQEKYILKLVKVLISSSGEWGSCREHVCVAEVGFKL